jgi:glycine/D-amino acid oxidase-like deaminating enzyme
LDFDLASTMPLEQNYWLTTVQMPVPPSQPLPESSDVAIVGCGFTGLSAALALSKRGARVTVLESETVGWGASSRNGGMVLTGLKLGVNQLISRYGSELTRRMYAVSLETIDTVERIIRDETIDCNFSRTGHLEVACKQSHFDDYARQAEVIAREFNHQLRVVPRDELRDEIGSDIYYGGMIDEVSAGLNPARYVAGLASAALRAGAKISECTRVQHIQRESRNGAPGFRLNTSRGTTWARDVFVATSGYTGTATPALRRKVIPIGSYIIVTEVLSDALARELSPRNRQIYDSKNYLYYYRLTPDNRLLFGGRAAFFPETTHTIRKSAEILRRGMIEVYPQLHNTKLDHVWGGTLDFCFDMMPHAGRIDGVHFAFGYAGHGVAMATWQGQKMAQWIAGDISEESPAGSMTEKGTMSGAKPNNPFAEISFPGAPLGLYTGRPWFLPFAGMYYKVLDWIS